VRPTSADPHAGPAEVSTVLADNATAAVNHSWLVHGAAVTALVWPSAAHCGCWHPVHTYASAAR